MMLPKKVCKKQRMVCIHVWQENTVRIARMFHSLIKIYSNAILIPHMSETNGRGIFKKKVSWTKIGRPSLACGIELDWIFTNEWSEHVTHRVLLSNKSWETNSTIASATCVFAFIYIYVDRIQCTQ